MENGLSRPGELASKRRGFLGVAAAIALTAVLAASLTGCGQASQSSASSSTASASVSSTASASASASGSGTASAAASSAASASASSSAASVTASIPDGAIEWTEASAHIGETVSVYGPVKGSSYMPESEGQHTYVDIGAEYPDEHRASMDIPGESRGNFPGDPESIYLGKMVCVTGEVYEHDGIPYIRVASADQVKVLD